MSGLKEFADMVNNQIGKHGGCYSVEEAVNELTNWQLACILLGKDQYSLEDELNEL